MYLRSNRHFKNGKEHHYWSIVESRRCAGGKVVQRQVLYLGEINDSQRGVVAGDRSLRRGNPAIPAVGSVPGRSRGPGSCAGRWRAGTAGSHAAALAAALGAL